MIAPIVLFVFARPDHTRQTIDALAANILAKESDLIIYADAEKNEVESGMVKAVRDLINTVEGFRSVTIIERESNYGLTRNIIEGVAEVCNHYGRVIVMEDDIVTSPYFLSYMNIALDKYIDEKNIWHISGWNFPIDTEGLGESFFWRVMNCWGWATWADRWKHFTKDPDHIIDTWTDDKINRFNLDGRYPFWNQVIKNHTGALNTWAVFWYVTIFEHEGLCLNPSPSLVWNIGHDDSGENCSKSNWYSAKLLAERIPELPLLCEESTVAVDRIKLFCDMMPGSKRRKILNWFRSNIFRKNVE